MAGEWLAIDIGLPEKPETQELIDLTGEPVEVVCYRLWRLWGWASMNTVDGVARMTVPRLVRTCGGDDAFWRAVQAVGWLEINEAMATVAIPGWDRRFSQAAKARLQESDRKRAYESRNPGRKQPSAPSDAPPSEPPDGAPSDAPTAQSRRGEERRGEVPPPPREASQDRPAGQDGWPTLLDAWNRGCGKAWRTPANPPDNALDRLREPGWLEEALAAIEHLPRCKFFQTAVTLPQLVSKPGFARDVAGGKYDDVTKPRAGPRSAGTDDRRSAAEAAADWKRSAEDPEVARRRAEYLATKARKSGGAA